MRWRDVLAWAAGVAVFGTLIWLGAMFLHRLPADVNLIKQICVRNDALCVANPLQHPISLFVPRDLLIVIVGIPWFFLATLVAQDTYLLLRSDSVDGEVDREWLGRAAGWHFIIALGWVVLSTIVLLGPALYHNIYFLGQNAGSWLTALTGVSGAVTALLGKSS